MSTLQKLLNHLDEKFLDISKHTAQDVIDEIETYRAQKDEEYKKLKKENKLLFGKYKGYTIEELTKTLKGKDYCRWLLKQAWFDEKFNDLIEEMAKYGIKKN